MLSPDQLVALPKPNCAPVHPALYDSTVISKSVKAIVLPVRPTLYSAQSLAAFLRRKTVATLPELARALGGASHVTVARKLKQLGHLSSYSHRGKYYALPESARFDSLGLWCHDNRVRFSSHGSLRATALALVASSETGFRPAELDALLGVRTINTLALLTRNHKLSRVRLNRRTLYCSPDPDRQRLQVSARRIQEAGQPFPAPPDPHLVKAPAAAAIALFCSLLNEKQRRLFGGLVSLLCGHGGDLRAAALLDLHRSTVSRGRHELTSGDIETRRVRRPGAGRKPLQEKALDDRAAAATGPPRNCR